MDLLDAMQTFVRVAELRSFTAAAEQAGLPKATVSAAVRQLETRVGARLLQRTTRRVALTPDGQACYERCKDVLDDMDELQRMFEPAQGALTGRLRVDLPLGTASGLVVPQLPAFLAQHPGLELELSTTDRRVDLVREGFDCVMRVGTLTDSSLVARPLGHYRLMNVASPAYVAQHGPPRTLDDLARHRLVHYVPTLGARSPGFETRDAAGAPRFLPMPGAVTVNNSEAYLAACLAGLGIIQAPAVAMRPRVARGELVEVLPDAQAAPMPVHLLVAHRRQLPRRVRAFMAWLEDLMRPHLEGADRPAQG